MDINSRRLKEFVVKRKQQSEAEFKHEHDEYLRGIAKGEEYAFRMILAYIDGVEGSNL